MMVVSLLLVLIFSMEVLASSGYDRQETDACITISERVSVKGGSETTDALYHYTTKEGAESIQKSGVIKADNRGRVFVTTDQIPSDEVNNALFMGRKPESGTHIVEIYLNDPTDINLSSIGATQPNELIYNGSIRNGRNATLVIKENGY